MNDSSTNATASFDQLTVFETIFYMGNGAMGAVFNFVVLYIAFRHIDMEDKPRQIIVVNMTVADFLFCVVYVMTRPFLRFFPVWSCSSYYVTIWTCQLCSCFNLLWLNLDKLIYIQFPLHYCQLVNKRRVYILSAVTWFVLISMSLSVDHFMEIKDNCSQVRLSPTVYLPICIVYVLLILASFVCSAIIYVIAHTTTRMESVARSQMLRRLLFLFSSTLWTFFTCLPYRMLYLISLVFPNVVSQTFIEVTSQFFRVLVVGIVVNAVITIGTQYIYRNRVFDWCGIRPRRSNGEVDTIVSTAPRKQSTKMILEGIPLNTKSEQEY